MRSPAIRMPSHDRGFGLIELLITLVLSSIVLVAVMMSFFRTARDARTLTEVTDVRQSARTAVQLVEREIRMAGSGWGRLNVYGNNSSGQPDTLLAVRPGYCAGTSNDSLVLVGAWKTSTTISSGMPNASSVLKVADVAGFANGDLIIITNGSSAHMMQVTGTNSSSMMIQHNPASPYNNPGGHNATWPASGYGAGANVYKITISSYSFDATSYRKPALIRHEYGQAPQVLAYNVDGFRVWYELQDGSWTRNPPNLSVVDKVSPVVLTRTTDSHAAVLRDSVWAAVQPRTF